MDKKEFNPISDVEGFDPYAASFDQWSSWIESDDPSKFIFSVTNSEILLCQDILKNAAANPDKDIRDVMGVIRPIIIANRKARVLVGLPQSGECRASEITVAMQAFKHLADQYHPHPQGVAA